jgi:hypothetical protein
MSKFDREAMIAEATDFGLDYKGNISNVALAEMLAEFKGEPSPELDAPPSPAAKPDEDTDEVEAPEAEEGAPVKAEPKLTAAQAHYARQRLKIAAAKKRAMKTSIVTITNRDGRENEIATTAFLSCENQYFSIGRSVPLDMPVQLEQCLIENARTCKIPQHRDEIKDGRRTGNKVTIMVTKYVISYTQRS